MTGETLQEAIARLCPHCKAGHKPRLRKDTREWVHDRSSAMGASTGFSTVVCGANYVRRYGMAAAQ